MTMVTARNCTETRFNQLWDALHEKSSAENESLFQQELHRCRSKRQRSKLAGRFAGAWQTLFDAFCEGRVFCSLLDSVIHQESISEWQVEELISFTSADVDSIQRVEVDMGQRKCAAAFLLAEEMYQIPATKSVILARDLEERGLYLRAARRWGEVMFEHTQCTEYIVEQRERCIRLSNSRHEDRIRQHEQASDLQYIHKHINDVYTRMGLKDDGVFNTA